MFEVRFHQTRWDKLLPRKLETTLKTKIWDCKIILAIMMKMMTRVLSSPSSHVSSLKYSPRRVIRASRDHLRAETLKSHQLPSGSSSTSLCSCGRKHFLEAASPTMPFLPICSPNASRSKVICISFYLSPRCILCIGTKFLLVWQDFTSKDSVSLAQRLLLWYSEWMNMALLYTWDVEEM